MREYWRNDYCRVFEIIDGNPELQLNLGVFRIMESEYDDARVIFYGHLPFRDGAIIPEGKIYEIVEFALGDAPDNYKVGTVLVRFEDCFVRRHWVSRPVAVSPADATYVRGYAEVMCKVMWGEK